MKVLFRRPGWVPLIALMAAAWPGASVPAHDGTLVIVGGALKPENSAIFEAFIDSLPESGKVVVIPAASGSPSSSARSFADDLNRYDFDMTRVEMFPVAVRDDESTDDVDESQWLNNAWDVERVKALGEPAGFWFTGGDQTRITTTLLREPGSEAPLLALIRQRLADGATVGGTSAGAAIMSRVMIAGGESFTALTEPPGSDYDSISDQESGRLLMGTGLGFLPGVIIDQHFDRKARLGRLVRAMGLSGVTQGYGIDEDTALIVDLEQKLASVKGAGGVTMIFAAESSFNDDNGMLATELDLGFASRGATFPLGQCRLKGPVGDATVGKEYFDYAVTDGGGMAFGNQRLDQLLGYELLDNSAAQVMRRISLRGDGQLLEYRFTQTPESTGYWTDQQGPSRYSICGVRFDIRAGTWSEDRNK